MKLNIKEMKEVKAVIVKKNLKNNYRIFIVLPLTHVAFPKLAAHLQ